jgi:serine phosphatase RsbU (regulator of sigma subunit)
LTPPGNDEPALTVFISPGRPLDTLQAPEVIGHYLVLIGTAQGKRVEVGAEPVTIGRDEGQTFVFADSQVSRRHARVSLVNGEVVAEDLKSTNGTFVGTERITTPFTLREGNVLRIGGQFLKYERRSQRDVKQSQDLDRDLRKASKYVLSLLPAPLTVGPVRANWRYVPSTQLGGDAFGYDWLDPDTFMFHLIDVSGHGVGSAMHSVTVLNVLRQRALPGVDFKNPAAVLSSLNERFQMDSHSGMYFTMWYGIYRPGDRTLTFGSAGHHPAFLVAPDRQESQPLGAPALMIGAMPASEYQVQQTTVPAGSALYLFSDGVVEIETKDEKQWSLADFLPLLLEQPHPGTSEAERLYQAVTQAARPGPLDDDFSLLVLTFV